MNPNPNTSGLTPFTGKDDPRRGHRPKGAKNRSTSARKILALAVSNPEEFLQAVQQIFPNALDAIEDLEDVINLKKAQIALTGAKDADANSAGDSLLDSAYGKPKQETETTVISESKADYSKLSISEQETLLALMEKAEANNEQSEATG